MSAFISYFRRDFPQNLGWMTYSICIIVVMVDIFVARRFDRHYCLLPKTDFSQSQLMNEKSDVLRADYLSTSLHLDLDLVCATTHQHSRSRVCVCTWSLSREDYACTNLWGPSSFTTKGYVLFVVTLRPWRESLDFDVVGRIWLSCVFFWMD